MNVACGAVHADLTRQTNGKAVLVILNDTFCLCGFVCALVTGLKWKGLCLGLVVGLFAYVSRPVTLI